MSDVYATRKDPNSERLASNRPETNPMPIKPETASHVAEQLSQLPSPSHPPPRQPFPIKSLALTAHISSDNSFQVSDKSLLSGRGRGPPFLHQNHKPGENIFQMCICAEGNGTHSSILVWAIPWTEAPGRLQSNHRALLKRGNSPRKVEALTKGPEAFDGTARTVAEHPQLPGLLVLASLTRYGCGNQASWSWPLSPDTGVGTRLLGPGLSPQIRVWKLESKHG